jgi:hypothetical protein
MTRDASSSFARKEARELLMRGARQLGGVGGALGACHLNGRSRRVQLRSERG